MPGEIEIHPLGLVELVGDTEGFQDFVQALAVDDVDGGPRPFARDHRRHARPVAGTPSAREGLPVDALDALGPRQPLARAGD